MCVVTPRPSGRPAIALVDLPDVAQVQVLGVLAALGDLGSLRRVVEVGQAGVVQLQVGAAELGDPPHLLRVRGGEVGPELLHVRVDVPVDRRRTAAVVHHVRRRDGELRRRVRSTIDCRKRKSSAKIVWSSRILLPTCSAAGVNSMLALGVAELHREVARRLADAAELVDEVHVPGRAAELAVGGASAARPRAASRRRSSIAASSTARSSSASIRPAAKSLAGGQQLGRAQQAADVVGAGTVAKLSMAFPSVFRGPPAWQSGVVLGQRGRGGPRRGDVAQLSELQLRLHVVGARRAMQHRGHPPGEVRGPPDPVQADGGVGVRLVRLPADQAVQCRRQHARRRRARGSGPWPRSAARCARRPRPGTAGRAAWAR